MPAPKPYERRLHGLYPYYRLAVWEARSFTYRDKATPHTTAEEAKAKAKLPGKYRVSKITEHEVTTEFDFEIT